VESGEGVERGRKGEGKKGGKRNLLEEAEWDRRLWYWNR